MFDPRSPMHRRMWHYESDRPLSAAQLVSLGSLDARTAALIWLLIERHSSIIVSGPTDPTPGVGKTTTLNAMLGFLAPGSTLVYTMGMYEDFEFEQMVEPETTCVLANEVSNHLRIYMWDSPARKLLRLPAHKYAIATSCHADTITDVLKMLTDDLRLGPADISRLGLIVNIGLVGELWPPRRRFLTVHYVAPTLPAEDADGEIETLFGVRLLPLSIWDATSDTFISADQAVMNELAGIVGLTPGDFAAAIDRRERRMAELSEGRGASIRVMRGAVDALIEEEQIDATGKSQSTTDR